MGVQMVGFISRLSGGKAALQTEHQIAGPADVPLSGVTEANQAGAGRAKSGSFISNGLDVVGNIESKGDIEICGRVTGDVTGRGILLAATGIVEGSIIADTIDVLGHVNGPITAITVTLRADSRVTGKITHHEIIADNDAVAEGLKPWQPLQFFTG